MNVFLRLILISITLVFICSGCTKSAPKCSDSSTVGLVKEIWLKRSTWRSLDIDSIRTTNYDEKTGAYACAADATVDANEYMKFPIRYTSELTSDGKQYVTIY